MNSRKRPPSVPYIFPDFWHGVKDEACFKLKKSLQNIKENIPITQLNLSAGYYRGLSEIHYWRYPFHAHTLVAHFGGPIRCPGNRCVEETFSAQLKRCVLKMISNLERCPDLKILPPSFQTPLAPAPVIKSTEEFRARLETLTSDQIRDLCSYYHHGPKYPFHRDHWLEFFRCSPDMGPRTSLFGILKQFAHGKSEWNDACNGGAISRPANPPPHPQQDDEAHRRVPSAASFAALERAPPASAGSSSAAARPTATPTTADAATGAGSDTYKPLSQTLPACLHTFFENRIAPSPSPYQSILLLLHSIYRNYVNQYLLPRSLSP
jgi:hypothetical protein